MPIYMVGGLRPDGMPIVVGVAQGRVRRYSDPLLILFAQITMPERYGLAFGLRPPKPRAPTGNDVVRLARALAQETGGHAGIILAAAVRRLAPED